MVPRARTTTGQRSFAVNGPTIWNSLPAALQAPDRSLVGFKHHLKTYLFEQYQSLTGTAVTVSNCGARYKCLHYANELTESNELCVDLL